MRLVEALRGAEQDRPPVWLMRQAGRYLPEYRALRQRVGGFLELCYDPKLACEVTMQPIRRFGMDAAILFSDILVVPDALGQGVAFRDGEGPVLDAIDGGGVDGLTEAGMVNRLAPVLETVERVRGELASEVALIGFAGAPWTVATYMVEGGSSKDFAAIKTWAFKDPDGFSRLIDLLARVTADYLIALIRSGVNVVQLFDTWAGVLPAWAFERWVVAPTRQIVDRVRATAPDIPIIGFPRGAGVSLVRFADGTGVDGVGLDSAVPLDWARDTLQSKVAVQGNLDPMMLVAGGDAMLDSARDILRTLGGGGLVFNLGHGVVPATPPEHVAALVSFVQDWRG